jgi:uncharacterized protein
LVAVLHLPDGAGPHPAVVVLGGSGGGVASANLFGRPLASQGVAALCLAYFAMEGLPAGLTEIPLEYFKIAIDWLRAHPDVDARRVGVFGSSRGGEAALLIGAYVPEIAAVVANVPSHVVWQGMATDTPRSSWSVAGTGLPFASLVVPRVGTSWCDWFDASLTAATPANALIPVERTNGAILLVSGTHDAVWPSSTMADRVIARLRESQFAHPAEHARYDGAGHVVLMPPYQVGPIENPWPAGAYRQPTWMASGAPPLVLGGSSEANRMARQDAWPKMVGFLRQHL